jgi:hypothetical protein
VPENAARPVPVLAVPVIAGVPGDGLDGSLQLVQQLASLVKLGG